LSVSEPSAFGQFLLALNLQKIESELAAHDVDDLKTLRQCTTQDLVDFGLKRGAQIKIAAALSEML
jgi:hypothetical protein